MGAAQQPDVQSAFDEHIGRQIWLMASEMQYEPGQQLVPSPQGRVPAGRQLGAQKRGSEHTLVTALQ